MSVSPDLYEILGISPYATENDIKQAYRRLARQFHPDINEMSPEANAIMRMINEAFTVLSDPNKRRNYDIPNGYGTLLAKFKKGDRVKVISRSTPYQNHTGVVDREPEKDTLRFWYTVRFDSKYVTGTGRFAEEELSPVTE